MKDLFSSNAKNYLQYRPDYPEELFECIVSHAVQRSVAWDCGTGNGQAAIHLAKYFTLVQASDLSATQLKNALPHPSVQYQQQIAEKTDYPDHCFDLIVVAQAIHWFDFEAFYKEVVRTAQSNALLAIIGYHLLKVTPEIDQCINHFYNNIVGPYWDKERKWIDEGYQTIPFPFKEIIVPSFDYTIEWTFDHLIGYLNTWSAVSHYIKVNSQNPVELIEDELKLKWGNNATRTIHFPILFRLARIGRI